ncbi:MAG: 16S rRNA (uracil(1498)-N(3))-methyltransferase [Verrucomicrobiales bacterium]|nr:16S rRNA (uracil(1498)-N(3))-methyltransferase [Verrucomicrobiales bacterium]|tara:strand:+ start:20710 stop:21471 length:762 start_codon:yes stop_codon:yes gene_type:complete
MHRFYLPPAAAAQPELTLDERESHHAVNVLRVRAGERVAVMDGAGGECLCEVIAADKKAVHLAVKQRNRHEPLPYRITLLQAMTKGKSMDFIVQKATELCVHRIVPLAAERSVVQVDADDAKSKVDKWRAIAIDSIKQCGCPWLPEIEPPVTPRAQLARDEAHDLSLIASLQGNTRHPRECVEEYAAEHGAPPATLSIWIGPEGDFTPAESNEILSAGHQPITLGRVVLRSETAAVYILSCLNYELQAPVRVA